MTSSERGTSPKKKCKIMSNSNILRFIYQIRATDGGIPSKSNSVRVNIVVLPVPDESAHVPFIKQPNQQVDVTENDSVGFLVALIQAADDDGDHLWYHIESKNYNIHSHVPTALDLRRNSRK